MSNLAAVLEEYPDAETMYTAPDGGVYSLGVIKGKSLYDGPYSGGCSSFTIRTEWLEETGLGEPETLDDLLEVLRAMKENHPESIPFGGSYASSSGFQIVLSALGFTSWNSRNSEPFTNIGLVGDEASFIYGDQELYKPFLEFYNTMYTEGLMNEDYFSDDAATVIAYGDEGLYGVVGGAPAFNYAPSLYLEYSGLEPLVSDYNDTQIWTESQGYYTIGLAVVTSNCDNPSVAAEFLDALYDPEIAIRVAAGPWCEDEEKYIDMEGWYIENLEDTGSTRVYIDIVEGTSISTETDYNSTLVASTGYNLGYFPGNVETMCNISGVEFIEYALDATTEQGSYRMTILENLAPYFVTGYPTVTYMDDEITEELTDLQTVITAYAVSELAKFVTGQRAITDEELEKYFEELDQIGYQEYLAIYADYYDSIN